MLVAALTAMLAAVVDGTAPGSQLPNVEDVSYTQPASIAGDAPVLHLKRGSAGETGADPARRHRRELRLERSTSLGTPAPSFLRDEINWSAFLARADMVWEFGNASAPLPTSWGEAAFSANGLLSIAALFQSDHVVQFELGRADVWSCGSMPMLPIGALQLSLGARVAKGQWRLSLQDAVITGNMTLVDGSSAWFRFWTAATSQVVILEHGSSIPGASAVRFVPKLPIGRGMVGPVGPAAECSNATDDDVSGVTSVCVQLLTVDNDGRAQDCGSFATAVRSRQLSAEHNTMQVLVSIANQQVAARQYPPPSAASPAQEAGAAVHLTTSEVDSLWSEHTAWWRNFYPQSMVSVPDTPIESYLAIQAYKLGSATRREGTPIMSLVGPFRMDAVEVCPAERSVKCQVNCPEGMLGKELPIYGSAWLGLWFDYNVEMAYWPVFISGHADLAMSLAHGLHAGMSAMTDNCRNVSGGVIDDGMGVVAGAGLNLKQPGLIGVPGCLQPGNIPDYRHTQVPITSYKRGQTTDGLPFSSHTVWSSCITRGNLTCLRSEAMPLLLPALRWYNHFLTTNGTATLHLPPTHSSDYPGPDGWDCTLDISLLSWGCRAVLGYLDLLDRAGHVATEEERGAAKMCADVAANLTEPHVDPRTGSLMVYDDISFATPHRSIGHMFQFYPLHTWTYDMLSKRDVLTSSLDTFIRVNGNEQRNDFYWTGLIVLSALARRGDAALGNASQWFSSAFHGGGETLTPTTMYSEGGNPTLEGGVDPAVGIYAMLLQAFPDDPVASHEMVLRVFPAVPSSWPSAVFHKLRAYGGLVVSGAWGNHTTQWIEISSQPEEHTVAHASFVVDIGGVMMGGEMVVRSSSSNTTLSRVAPSRLRIDHMPTGSTILLARNKDVPLVVAPVPLSNSSKANWWGPHPHPTPPVPPPPPMPRGFALKSHVIGMPGFGQGVFDCNGHVRDPSGCPAFAATQCAGLGSRCKAVSLSSLWKGAMVAQWFNTTQTMEDKWTTWIKEDN